MACEFKVMIGDMRDSLESSYSVVNPILQHDIKISSNNNILYRNIPGLYKKIKESILKFTNKKGIMYKRSFIILFQTKSKTIIRIYNMVLGKNNIRKSNLEEAIYKLNDYGRTNGLWSITVPLSDAYGEIPTNFIISSYVNIMKDYPGIVTFLVSDEKERSNCYKIIRKIRKNNR